METSLFSGDCPGSGRIEYEGWAVEESTWVTGIRLSTTIAASARTLFM